MGWRGSSGTGAHGKSASRSGKTTFDFQNVALTRVKRSAEGRFTGRFTTPLERNSFSYHGRLMRVRE